jgi:hypothetical protein
VKAQPAPALALTAEQLRPLIEEGSLRACRAAGLPIPRRGDEGLWTGFGSDGEWLEISVRVARVSVKGGTVWVRFSGPLPRAIQERLTQGRDGEYAFQFIGAALRYWGKSPEGMVDFGAPGMAVCNGLRALDGPLATGFFKPERRVELHPATDRWMMGDRYGEIVRVKDGLVHVRLDKSGKTFRFKPDDILHPGNRNP